MTLRVTRQYIEVAQPVYLHVIKGCSIATDCGYATRAGAFDNADDNARFGRGASPTIYDAFYKFDNITISKGVVVTEAYLTWTPNATDTYTVNSKIYGVLEADAVAPTDYSEYANKVKTSNFAEDTQPPWTATTGYRSIDFSSVIQEIIDQEGWVSGNSLLLLLEDNSSSTNNQKILYYDKIFLVIKYLVDEDTHVTNNIPIISTARSSLMSLGADNYLTLGATASLQFESRTLNCQADLTSSVVMFDELGRPFDWHYRLGDYIDIEIERAPKGNNTKIRVLPSASAFLLKSTATEVSCTSEINISSDLGTELQTVIAENIEVVPEVSVEKVKTLAADITITPSISVSKIIGVTCTSRITITEALAYELVNKAGRLCSYSMYVGNKADMPPIPMIIKGSGVKLEYQSTTVILKSPSFGNTDSISFNRINRVSRGGTLQVYSDPRWPKSQNMSLEFVGLSEEECQSVLALIDESLGRDIKITDWEGRTWIGIITNPDTAISRVGSTGNLLSLALEVKQLLEADATVDTSINTESTGEVEE
ncbi:MAG: hypothetical protein WC942_02465 [Clostridia bacterium]|jgi:hypothetical protein